MRGTSYCKFASSGKLHGLHRCTHSVDSYSVLTVQTWHLLAQSKKESLDLIAGIAVLSGLGRRGESGYLTRVRWPSLATSRCCSTAATFSQSLRDRQYTIPHCGRPWWQNWRQIRSSISPMASSNLAFFFTTSYLRIHPC